MDSNTLATLVSQRFDTLVELLEISQHQVDAVKANRMTDLMRILSEKQQPIQRLSQLAQQLRPALADDPEARHWPDPSLRSRCKEQQQRCEVMHANLLQIEADCEAILQESRADMSERLERFSSGANAATGYSQAQNYSSSNTQSSAGSTLDLSSD